MALYKFVCQILLLFAFCSQVLSLCIKESDFDIFLTSFLQLLPLFLQLSSSYVCCILIFSHLLCFPSLLKAIFLFSWSLLCIPARNTLCRILHFVLHVVLHIIGCKISLYISSELWRLILF